VLAGAFLPTFSMQILNGILAAALFIVALMWTAWSVVRWRGNRATLVPPSATEEQAASEQAASEQEQGGPTNV
jgi:hypothetical protein